MPCWLQIGSQDAFQEVSFITFRNGLYAYYYLLTYIMWSLSLSYMNLPSHFCGNKVLLSLSILIICLVISFFLFLQRERNNLQNSNSVFVFNVSDRENLDRPTARLIKEFSHIEGSLLFQYLCSYFFCSISKFAQKGWFHCSVSEIDQYRSLYLVRLGIRQTQWKSSC